jgi:hypothetical protein
MRPPSGAISPAISETSVVFPRAVRADQRMHLAGRDRQGDIVGGAQRAEGFADAFDLQRGHARRFQAAQRSSTKPTTAPAAEQHDQHQRGTEEQQPALGQRGEGCSSAR